MFFCVKRRFDKRGPGLWWWKQALQPERSPAPERQETGAAGGVPDGARSPAPGVAAAAARPRAAAITSLLAAGLLAACASGPVNDDANLPAEKLYAQAREDLDAGAFDKAAKTLERVEGRAAGTVLAQQASIDLAYAQWRSGERAQAIATLDRFIRLHPSSPALDYALYLKGLINFNDNGGLLQSLSRQDITERDQQASRDAHQAFALLVQQFPQSIYADDARQRMDYIANALAAYEVHVARYYYRRGAFLAAANRAQLAVTDYPQAPALEEALYIMAISYDKLGLGQLRQDAERVLLHNFPETRHMKNGVRVPEKAWWQFW